VARRNKRSGGGEAEKGGASSRKDTHCLAYHVTHDILVPPAPLDRIKLSCVSMYMISQMCVSIDAHTSIKQPSGVGFQFNSVLYRWEYGLGIGNNAFLRTLALGVAS
jgi:hypothetical protein